MVTTDLYSALQPYLAQYDEDQIVVVAAQRVADKWRSKVPIFPISTIENGEAGKSLKTVERIWDFMLDHRITRRGLLICVGGGVVTDMGGFAAATYKRGINYINIPTTLLAMVDASTGGKTGINYHGLKNCIGAFYSPIETIIYTPWLESLPSQQLLSGFAEMLKHAILSDEIEYNLLLSYDLDVFNLKGLAPRIERSIEIKKSIVEIDENEHGLRKILNFGHTFGHALEEMAIDNSEPMLHGYAVLYGMIAELYLSVTLLGMDREPLQQLTQLMLHYYCKPECKCRHRDRLVDLMRQDKKNDHSGEINCTLLRAIGEPCINQVITPEQAEEAFEYLFSL